MLTLWPDAMLRSCEEIGVNDQPAQRFRRARKPQARLEEWSGYANNYVGRYISMTKGELYMYAWMNVL